MASEARGQPARRRRKASAAEPRRVVASLADAARLIGAEGALELAAVKQRWPEVVGPQVAGHCSPLSLHDGVLTVVVDHNAWASELRILSAELLGRIRSSGPGVRALVVQVSPCEGRGW